MNRYKFKKGDFFLNNQGDAIVIKKIDNITYNECVIHFLSKTGIKFIIYRKTLIERLKKGIYTDVAKVVNVKQKEEDFEIF